MHKGKKMQTKTKITVQNRQIRICTSLELYNEQKEFIDDQIEESINDGYDCGEVCDGINWYIPTTRIVKIFEEIYHIDEDLKSDQIQEVLTQTGFQIEKFIEIVEKDFLIKKIEVETIDTVSSNITKTILLREDKEIDISAYNVPELTDNLQIQQIIKFANELWYAINDDATVDIDETIKNMPIKLTVDNFKIGGEYMDDFHSIFTVLLKEFGIKFQPTIANVFQC